MEMILSNVSAFSFFLALYRIPAAVERVVDDVGFIWPLEGSQRAQDQKRHTKTKAAPFVLGELTE